MILLIDAGNTRIKWACMVGGILQSGDAVRRSGDEHADIRALSLTWAPLPRPGRILAASVVAAGFSSRLLRWSRETWDLDVDFISAHQQAYGVVNGYTAPGQLGADRWAALIAARRITAGPVCVFDCGTALTVDVMARDGRHLGGLIIPGHGLMRRALIGGTQGIRIEPEGAHDAGLSLFARDTESGVAGGALYASVAAIDRLAKDLRRFMGRGLRCMLTGGDAETLLPLLAGRFDYQPELVLKGLAVVAEDGA